MYMVDKRAKIHGDILRGYRLQSIPAYHGCYADRAAGY